MMASLKPKRESIQFKNYGAICSSKGIPIAGLMNSWRILMLTDQKIFPSIQAQRDYFRAHTYERIDIKGIFHTEWND
jgi:6-phosphogluconate dehydrogenase